MLNENCDRQHEDIRVKPEDYAGLSVLPTEEKESPIRPNPDDFKGLAVVMVDRFLQLKPSVLIPLATLIVIAIVAWREGGTTPIYAALAVLLLWIVVFGKEPVQEDIHGPP